MFYQKSLDFQKFCEFVRKKAIFLNYLLDLIYIRLSNENFNFPFGTKNAKLAGIIFCLSWLTRFKGRPNCSDGPGRVLRGRFFHFRLRVQWKSAGGNREIRTPQNRDLWRRSIPILDGICQIFHRRAKLSPFSAEKKSRRNWERPWRLGILNPA